MAVYYSFHCAKCKLRVVNDDKRRRYIHAGVAPEKEPHKPVVVSKKMEEGKSA